MNNGIGVYCLLSSKIVFSRVTINPPCRRALERIADAAKSMRQCWVVCLIVLPNASMADAWVVQPSVALEGIYDDNFRLDVDDEAEVGTARAIGAVGLARVSETVDIAGLLRVDGNYYFGDDEDLEDRSNQLLDFSYFRTGELSRLGGIFSYRRDTLLRTIKAVEDPEDVTIEPDEDVDEGLVRQDVERQRLSLGPSWSRFLTERTEVGLSYEFSDVSFSNVPPGAEVVDYDNHDLGASLLRRVTERDRLALVFEGRRYKADNDREYNSYDLQTGVVHDFSETATGVFTVGARHTEFGGALEALEDDTGFVFTLGGDKRTGLTTFSGELERTVRPSASGNQVETDQFAFNVSRRLTERTRLLVRSRVFETEALQEQDSGANRRYITIGPRLQYELTPSWALEAAYEYRREKEFDEAESADSNAVYLTLVYERPVVVEPGVPEDLGDDVGIE